MSEDRISKADDKVGVSDLAFDRYEAEYERVLYMGKAYEMFGYEHQRMARRAMINLVIAECGVQSAELAIKAEGYVAQVPDKCDRITWKGRYYHLPLEPQSAKLRRTCCGEWDSLGGKCSDCPHAATDSRTVQK